MRVKRWRQTMRKRNRMKSRMKKFQLRRKRRRTMTIMSLTPL